MADAPCAVCGGTKNEHYEDDGKTPRTQHVYTTTPGEMVTHAEKEKQKQQVPQLSGAPLAAVVNSQPNSVGRLVEVLLDAGVIRTQDALYIANMGSKPSPPTGFSDPAQHPFYQPTPGAGY
jgi:hypothetical protein